MDALIGILVVEDDVQFNRILCTYLTDSGYTAVGVYGAEQAFGEMEKMAFDVIISDIMMKDIDGFEFASLVRATNKLIPILFITARDDIGSKQRGFHLGIDDYMVKPIDMNELGLRIEAVLRRARIANQKKLIIGDLVLDSAESAAYHAGEDLKLSVKEFNILFKLLSYPKRTFTRTQMMNDFWGFDSESAPRTVDVCITKLRAKLSECHEIEIVTVHGLGYKAVILQ